MKKVIVIVGPTAVGKSDFAIELAKKINGEIISGDSIQVYQGLDIGSGKVTQEEMDGVPHHLIDIYTTKQSYTVADFQSKARELIDQSEKPMIICGGTGLYIKACLYDYQFSDESGAGIDIDLENYTNEELYQQLLELDPKQSEKIHPNNRQRLLRSLTIARRSPKVQSEMIADQQHRMLYDARITGCTMPREQLYARMKGIGYREWEGFHEGKKSLEEVKEEIQKHSRQFAKRQYTWFNHQMDVEWFENNNSLERKAMLENLVHWYQNQE